VRARTHPCTHIHKQPPAAEFLLSPTNPPDYTRRRRRIDKSGVYKPKKKKDKTRDGKKKKRADAPSAPSSKAEM
jgi:hypothetical protein